MHRTTKHCQSYVRITACSGDEVAANSVLAWPAVPSSLSVSTPKIGSSKHSDLSIQIRHQNCSVVRGRDAEKSDSKSPREQRRDHIIVHQRKGKQPVREPEIMSSSLSIKDRLAEICWNQQNIAEELREHRTILPLIQLLPGPIASGDSVASCAAQLLLEIILTKCDESSDEQDVKSAESQQYALSFVQSLVSQRKYGEAALVLDGILRGPHFAHLSDDHKIKLFKLRLRNDIGDHFEEPRLMSRVETSCTALFEKETNSRGNPSNRCLCSSNLIPAFLLRVYGINLREVKAFDVSTLATTLRQQLSDKQPPMSAIWAAQQHIRYCLRSHNYAMAERLLKLVRKALVQRQRKNSLEADLTDYLYEQLQSFIHHRGRARKPDIVEIYYRHAVDDIWLDLFKAYVQDAPHRCPDEVRPTRDMDPEYWH